MYSAPFTLSYCALVTPKDSWTMTIVNKRLHLVDYFLVGSSFVDYARDNSSSKEKGLSH